LVFWLSASALENLWYVTCREKNNKAQKLVAMAITPSLCCIVLNKMHSLEQKRIFLLKTLAATAAALFQGHKGPDFIRAKIRNKTTLIVCIIYKYI